MDKQETVIVNQTYVTPEIFELGAAEKLTFGSCDKNMDAHDGHKDAPCPAISPL